MSQQLRGLFPRITSSSTASFLSRNSIFSLSPHRTISFPSSRSFSSSSSPPTALSSRSPRSDFSDSRPFPTQSRVVLIGGGVVGCSVAYHLSKLGWGSDVLLLESGSLGCGTTWHAAGLVGQMRSTASETALSGVYGSALYAKLEAETGVATGFRRTGSLTLARTADRLTLLQRNASRARSFGIEAHLISGKEAGELWPHMKWEDLVGALWLPGDGTITSSDLTASLAAGAKQKGVKIYERTKVTGIKTERGKIIGVETDKGFVKAEIIVNTAGQWARQVGALAGVNVPLHSAEHFYIVTKPLNPPVSVMLPVMRDPDVYTYYREWSGGLVMGGFEPKCKPCFSEGVPSNFEFSLLPEDWDHFSVLMEGAIERVPALETAEVKMVNGPESFTPDNQYILGEAPELRKFYVAAGFNSSGIASAGGAGKALADWIVNDAPQQDLWGVDIRRFGGFQRNINYLRDRTFETLGLHYQINWPKREFESCRPLRRSALYSQLQQAGACFGSKFGWERPNWFSSPGSSPTQIYSFARQNWFDYSAKEHLGCRERVALFDQTSFAKFVIQGRDVVQVLNRLCSNEMDVPINRIVYTALLNEKGGMETDLTITRTSAEEYFIITSTAQATRDADWIRRSFGPNEFVTLTDVTSSYSVLSIMGPQSRSLLQRVSKSNVSNESFPFSTASSIDVGYAMVRAHRLTYVGELGWELYVPTELTVHVYETLKEAAKANKEKEWEDLGLVDAGYYAIDSLRIEKGYRAWGHELSPDYTPLEAGLGFAVKMDKKGGFVGREALMRQKENGLKRRLVGLKLVDAEAYALGDEPILRNGKLVGYVSSAAYGHSVGRAVGMGYVKREDGKGEVDKKWLEEEGTKYEIEINGKPFEVKISLQPFYDPKGEKIKM